MRDRQIRIYILRKKDDGRSASRCATLCRKACIIIERRILRGGIGKGRDERRRRVKGG